MNKQSEAGQGLAIAAVVCGVIGFCIFPVAIAALIMGIVSMNKIRDGQPGRGLALTGTILGGVGMAASIVVLLIAILLPALGAARSTARQMQNSTQLRGIHQGLVNFSMGSNKDRFPGLASNGEILPDGIDTGNSGEGNTPEARFWVLLDGQFFTPDYAISPLETEPITPYVSGPVSADNYSYAMLSVTPEAAGRSSEWSSTLNSKAVVLSDRNTGTDANANVASLTDGPGGWEGGVLWNDNRVSQEASQVQIDTSYGSGAMNGQDNLFVDETSGFDALMVYDTVE